MGTTAGVPEVGGEALLDLYDRVLPEVYGYLRRRCGSTGVAEDLTSETFLAAVDAVRKGRGDRVDAAWLIGVARHKLVDHWRAAEREQRRLSAVGSEPAPEQRWEVDLDAAIAHEVLGSIAPQHRCALALRYLDGLSVAEVAELIDRTPGATEVLLVRARRAFRAAYEAACGGEEDR